jgi:predicted peptidase
MRRTSSKRRLPGAWSRRARRLRPPTSRTRAAGLLAGSVLALASCSSGADPSSARLTLRPLGSTNGAPNGYAEYLPPGYGDGERRPLLVFLHGSGANGNGTRAALRRLFDTGLPALIENDDWPAGRPFIVLMPQHPADAGTLCPDADEIEAFIAFAMAHYDVDPKRVYLTGMSCGAIGAWDYLGKHTDEVVAAAVLIAGDGREAFAAAGCDLGRVPIWAFHGADDGVVDERGSVGPITRLEACTDPKPIDVRLTVYPDVGHDSWDQTYDLSAGHLVYAWLLSHLHP